MLYKPLKLTIIIGTVFVWLRLLVGTVEVLNNSNKSSWDEQNYRQADISLNRYNN